MRHRSWRLWCRMVRARDSQHLCLKPLHGHFAEFAKNPYFWVGRCRNTWRKLFLLTRSHHISILMEFRQTKEHGSLLKTFHLTVPMWLEPIQGQSFGNKMCGYMAPMNLWKFRARVFSLTGGGKKFRTGAGGFGLQSIVMELLINFACKRSKVNSRS